MMIQEVFTYFILFGLPLAALIWFIIALVLFLQTPKEDREKRSKRKTLLIVSAVLAAVFLLTIIGLMLLLMMAIANM